MKYREPNPMGEGYSRRFKVLFVAGCWYPHDENPFQGPFIRRHAEAVALRNDVTVLHPVSFPDGPAIPEIQWQDHDSVREVHIRFRGRPSSESGLISSQWGYFRAGLYGCRELRKRGFSPDIIHFHVVPSGALVLAVNLVFPKRPLVLTEHWTGYVPESNIRLGSLRRLYTGRLTRAAAEITVVSKYHERMMRRLGFRGKYVVIPNVVDTNIFCRSANEATGPFRFVHVSGIRPVKRVPDIVRAAVENIRRGVDLELHVVGAGSDLSLSREIAREACVLGTRVIFHGQLEYDKVAETVKASDCSVLFSDFENSPCVVGEALACGKPMLATRIAGIPEHITAERGVLVSRGDLEEFTVAMGNVVHRGRVWDTAALRAYAEQTFAQEAISHLFDCVYRRVLGRKLIKSG